MLHSLLSFSTFGGSAYLGAALPLTSPLVIKVVLRHLSFPFFVCKLLIKETVLLHFALLFLFFECWIFRIDCIGNQIFYILSTYRWSLALKRQRLLNSFLDHFQGLLSFFCNSVLSARGHLKVLRWSKSQS